MLLDEPAATVYAEGKVATAMSTIKYFTLMIVSTS